MLTVREIIAENCTDDAPLEAETRLADITDSMDRLNLFFEIEMEREIDIPDEDARKLESVTVGELEAYVAAQENGGSES